MQMKGRTLSLNEGKLLTSDVVLNQSNAKEINTEAIEMKVTNPQPTTETDEVPKESEP